MAKKSNKQGPLVREVRLAIRTPADVSGLNRTIELFKALNRQVQYLQGNLNKLNFVQMGPREIQERLKRAMAAGKNTPQDVAGMFGISGAEMKRFQEQIGGKFFKGASQEFASLRSGREFMTRVMKFRNEAAAAVMSGIRNAGGGPSAGTTVAPEALGKAAADQMLAAMEQMANRFTAAVSGRNPDGTFTGGGGAERSGKKKKGQGQAEPLMGAVDIPGQGQEVGRVVTRTPDYVRTVVKQAMSADRMIATTFDELKNEIKSVETTTVGKGALGNAAHRVGVVQEAFRRQKAGLRKGNILGLADLQEQLAVEMEKIVDDELRGALGSERYKKLHERMRGRAQTLRAQAAANRGQAMRGMMSGRTLEDVWASGAVSLEERERAAELEQAHVQNLRQRQLRVMQRAQQAAAAAQKQEVEPPPVIPPPMVPVSMGSRLKSGAAQFGRNTLKVGGWAASVGVVYGALGVAEDAFKTVLETGVQTQRLEQVFKGVGGSARELTVDVLKLAAAEGRSRDEAMEAAISWSRLGLSRRDVNEAVRESLVAANVAEMDAMEATEHLQAIMAAYGLTVRDLHGVLGQLNETSNTFNATNKDMLIGLMRTASVAKQAKLPLQELIGMLGAGIGTTGQSGAMIGNAIKSILVSLANPEIQKFLRNRYELEVTEAGGREMKPANAIFGELWEKYQGMNSGQRQALLQQVAGKTQASRMAAIMDSYVKGQVLAVNAQLNLNSAEEENAKIKDSLISKLKQLRSEWDAFIVAGDQKSGVSQVLGGMVGELTAVLKLLGSIPGVGALPGTKPGWGLFSGLDAMRQKFWPTTEEIEKGRDQALNERLQQAGGRGRAAGTTMELLRRLKRAGVNAGVLRAIGGLEGVGSDFASGLSRAVHGGDRGAVERVLDKEIDAAQERMKAAREEEGLLLRRERALLIESRVGAKTEEAQRDYDKKIEQISEQIRTGKRAGLISDLEENALAQFHVATLEGMTWSEKVRKGMGGITGFWRNVPGGSAREQMGVEVMSLLEQESFLKGRMGSLPGGKDQERLRTETMEQLHRVQAELGAYGDPGLVNRANRVDRAGVAREMALNAAGRFETGAMRIDQLNNRLGGLDRLIAQKEKLVQMGQTEVERENAFVAAQALRADRMQTILEMERERSRLMQQEYEYNRRLLTAGPQEMLQRMLARQVVNRGGMNAGGFLGFSPGVREAILEEEQSRRRREFMKRTPSTEEVQRRLGLMPEEGPAGGARLSEAVNAAAVDLGAFRETVSGAGAAVAGLRVEVDALRGAVQVLRGEMGKTLGYVGGGGMSGTGAPWVAQGHA